MLSCKPSHQQIDPWAFPTSSWNANHPINKLIHGHFERRHGLFAHDFAHFFLSFFLPDNVTMARPQHPPVVRASGASQKTKKGCSSGTEMELAKMTVSSSVGPLLHLFLCLVSESSSTDQGEALDALLLSLQGQQRSLERAVELDQTVATCDGL
jgi:hypothetical protein